MKFLQSKFPNSKFSVKVAVVNVIYKRIMVVLMVALWIEVILPSAFKVTALASPQTVSEVLICPPMAIESGLQNVMCGFGNGVRGGAMLKKVDFVGKSTSEGSAFFREAPMPILTETKPIRDECQNQADNNLVVVVLKKLGHIMDDFWWVYLIALWPLFQKKDLIKTNPDEHLTYP
jgi:hypothetical protein